MSLSHERPLEDDREVYDEPAAIARAVREPEAFAVLYRRHYPAIQRYLRRRLGDSHLVEDAVAETFLEAMRQMPRYEQRGLPFRSWLYRIATGRAHRHCRRAGLLALQQMESEPAHEESETQHPAAELVRAALLQVASRYQDVIALHYVEGFSVQEVAQTLDCRPGTVKSRLSRGREALRRQLERMGVVS